MSTPDDTNTLRLAMQPMNPGYPAIVDAAYTDALTETKAGGAGTQSYFDSLNQTADFWMLLADGAITLAPAHDAQGRSAMTASSGNVELRVQAVPQRDTAVPSKVGLLTITTRESAGTHVSHFMTANITVEHNPSGVEIDDERFTQLLPALYASTETALRALAVAFAANTQVVSPEVDAETFASKALFAASGKAIGLAAALVEIGLAFTAVTWGQMIAEGLGVGALMAIPAIIEFLGHTMTHSVIIDNSSQTALTWGLRTKNGVNALVRPSDPIPGRSTVADPLHPSAQLTLSSQLHLLHTNTTRETGIGYVLRLEQQKDGPSRVYVVVWIPIAGDNVVWVGSSPDDMDPVWAKHSSTPNGLSMSAAMGDSTVTVTLNKLTGTTDDAYFYCTSIVVASN